MEKKVSNKLGLKKCNSNTKSAGKKWKNSFQNSNQNSILTIFKKVKKYVCA